MKQTNPFPYSLDNKRYQTWNYYLRHQFGSKVFKVPISANFSCPNRDGTAGFGGCTFCGKLGSGETIEHIHAPLFQQFEEGKLRMKKKWPDGLPIAYFQAYTNTYATLPILQKTFDPFVEDTEIVALSIATRPDCLEDDKLNYFQSLTKKKEIWLELGLQSIFDKTAKTINRGHDYACFLDAIHRLSKTDIKICVHLINSLPNETQDQMIASAKAMAQLPIHALKIHMLHIMKDTQMELDFNQHKFSLMDRSTYIETVVKQLEVLPKEMIIQRLTGDGVEDELIAPLWTKKKTTILNDIDTYMAQHQTWQGRKFLPKKHKKT